MQRTIKQLKKKKIYITYKQKGAKQNNEVSPHLTESYKYQKAQTQPVLTWI